MIEIEFKFNEIHSRTHAFDGSTQLGPYFVNSEFREARSRQDCEKTCGRHDIDDVRLNWDAAVDPFEKK